MDKDKKIYDDKDKKIYSDARSKFIKDYVPPAADGSPIPQKYLDYADQEGREAVEKVKKAKKAQRESGSFQEGGSVMDENKMMGKMGRGMAKAEMQKVAGTAVKKHEKSMHGMKSGGSVSKRADGIAIKGKTKGRIV